MGDDSSRSDQAMDWKARWRAFGSIVFEPWSLLLLAIGVAFAHALTKQTQPGLLGTFTLMVSLISGVLGGLWTTRWQRLDDERVTVARGRVAVRSLKLLLGNINALDRRAKEYLRRCGSEDNPPVATYLEEVIERCGVLEEEALSSIENWTDVIPEADIRTQIGVISELRLEIDAIKDDREKLQEELEDIKGRSEEREQVLRAQIEEKERKETELRRKLSVQSLRGLNQGLGALSGGSLLSSNFSGAIAKALGPYCPICHQGVSQEQIDAGDPCPRCGNALS